MSELARLSRAGFLAFDRVTFNGGDQELASFAGVAKHWSVSVRVCPPRRGNRKGVVERPILLRRNAGGARCPTM